MSTTTLSTGYRFADLARTYGTPLYVYDLDEIDRAGEQLRSALPPGIEVYYAVKANPHPWVVRAVREGAGGARVRAEISSSGELAAALEAGFDGADCLYTGPGKTTGELREALAHGVRRFSTDSVTDVRRVGAAALAEGVVADCLLRVNAATGHGASGVRMTGVPSQFGFDSEGLPEAMPMLRSVRGARICGLHFFTHSNARDEDSLVGEFRHALELAAELTETLSLQLRHLDIGGGFAAPYGVPGPRAAYPGLRRALEAALAEHLPAVDGPTLAVESGRYLVGCAGTLVLRVSDVKASRGRTYVVADGGINVFGGLSGLGRMMPVNVVPGSGGGPANPVRGSLVGPLCTPGDVLGRDIELPELTPGDLLEVPNAGAYGVTAAPLLFLGRPAPSEVVVRGGSAVHVSRLHVQRRQDLPAEPLGAR